MRFAELFAGAGGLSLGLERAGWKCAWHAEISEQPRAILQHRWPNVPLLGDVTTLDGAALTALHGPIDLLSGGSPCQDLSVAGKRKGLGGGRSGLFYEQMRLWDETGADLCLWENVDGARSSNNGKDFGEVLRAFVGAAVPVPSDGWRSAGVAAGPLGVAAWRVLDAQFFGVPQRRRRVFVLGTRTGRVDPAEVLSLGEGMRGDSPQGRETREGAASSVDAGFRGESGVDPAGRYKNGSPPRSQRAVTDSTPTKAGVPLPRCPIAFSQNQIGDVLSGHVMHALSTNGNPTGRNAPNVLAFDTLNQDDTGTLAHSLRDGHGEGTPVVCITGEQTHALTHEGADASENGTGRVTPVVVGTLDSREHGGGFPGTDGACGGHIVAPTLSPGAHNAAPGLNGQDAHAHAMYSASGIPRRLTPRECERLMGWPDDHTLVPYNGKPLSDSARYKACWNGVASVHSHWIGGRLRLALEGADV